MIILEPEIVLYFFLPVALPLPVALVCKVVMDRVSFPFALALAYPSAPPPSLSTSGSC